MAKVQIDVQSRTDFGKGAARQLRRGGRVPAVVYGGDRPVSHVSLPGHDLFLALKKAEVILEIDVDGTVLNVAPRQVQRDPVQHVVEHVDLVVLSAREVRERLVVGAAVAKAEKVAIAEEIEPVTLVEAVRELLEEGLAPDDAIAKAVEDVKAALAEAAAASLAQAAAEDAAEAAEAADVGEAGQAEAPAAE
ncbi:MAG: 50S ribosomal protein L25 [Actinomycetes bacterium]